MTVEKTKVKIKTNIKLPNKYCVIYYNDDKTPASFVENTLINIFNYDIEKATILTNKISNDGKACVIDGLTKEIANHLTNLVMVEAQLDGYPLKVEATRE